MKPEMIPWWWTELGEAEAENLKAAIAGKHINCGEVCTGLEERLAGILKVPHVILTTSGSAALLLAFWACGVGPGDEVIMPAYTFIAGAHAAKLLGARIKLVDLEPGRPTINPDAIKAAISQRTKVIMPAHLNGIGCDMTAINNLASRHGIKVVEDAAQAFFSRNERGFLGTQSDLGIFSMGMTKLITTGEGGFVATHDAELAEKIKKLRNQGVKAIADNVFDSFGFNLRYTDLLASVAHAQLDRLEEKIIGIQRVYDFYKENIGNTGWLTLNSNDATQGELPLWTDIFCAKRDLVYSQLLDRGIQTRPYHPCLADSKHLGCTGLFPEARKIANQGLTLPSGPDQPKENLEKTVAALKEIGKDMS